MVGEDSQSCRHRLFLVVDYSFGYKLHAIVCARYGLPIAGFTTTASRPDTLFLTPLVDRARSRFQWCRPKHVIADQGYDSHSNYSDCVDRGAAPIIGIRQLGNDRPELHEGIYNDDAVPTCIGMVPMVLLRVRRDGGRIYRCRSEGCHLKDGRGVRYCHDRLFEPGDPDNPRLFGPVARGSRLWKTLHRLRQSVERVFKNMKQSRRLAAHCYRGFRRVALHVAMSNPSVPSNGTRQNRQWPNGLPTMAGQQSPLESVVSWQKKGRDGIWLERCLAVEPGLCRRPTPFRPK